MSPPSASTSFHPSPGWSPQRPARRSLRSGTWRPSIALVSGAGPVAQGLDELLVQVAHVKDEVTAESLDWEPPAAGSIPVRLASLQDADRHLESEDLTEEWDDDAPLALSTVATTTITVITNRAMVFSPAGDELDPGQD